MEKDFLAGTLTAAGIGFGAAVIKELYEDGFFDGEDFFDLSESPILKHGKFGEKSEDESEDSAGDDGEDSDEKEKSDSIENLEEY